MYKFALFLKWNCWQFYSLRLPITVSHQVYLKWGRCRFEMQRRLGYRMGGGREISNFSKAEFHPTKFNFDKGSTQLRQGRFNRDSTRFSPAKYFLENSAQTFYVIAMAFPIPPTWGGEMPYVRIGERNGDWLRKCPAAVTGEIETNEESRELHFQTNILLTLKDRRELLLVVLEKC